MKIRAVIFDIGQTLVYYPIPLNWSALYRPAFESVAKKNGLHITDGEYEHIGTVLSKYNTRIYPREYEVSSDVIFSQILAGTSIPKEYMQRVKADFYSYFRNDTEIYPEAADVLRQLRAAGIRTGTLSDVAYGMDNEYALADLRELIGYIDIPYTSNDTGMRKPCSKGLRMLSEKMHITTSKMIFVGDERKDIECASDAGAVSVLINRTDEEKNFGQDYEISSLEEIMTIIGQAL